MKADKVQPWYREPWPWILISIPFAGIVGCIITIYLAFNDNPDSSVILEYKKTGLVIERVGDGGATVPLPKPKEY
ncbi:FixH family protein [Basilea psittacipulmonis]|uniref:CcoH-like protein n=1 Tax=Basilea psittacipulmonis DSM 24701 TaxID=1072685 RepID=A0A077DCL9_9BURK|nr:FixH family protein [Basilea psittacipulmonis]AIL32344.1 hypothetical protein IX83_02535 [Basilea psittacipulmonis DSM 24701]